MHRAITDSKQIDNKRLRNSKFRKFINNENNEYLGCQLYYTTNLSLIQHTAKRKDHNQLLIFKQIQMINGLKNSTTSSVFGYAAEK